MHCLHSIKSFAILDIETTNIPQHNFNKANITEISIHGISSKDVRNGNTNQIPRVQHKLTMVFNPFMMIHPDAGRITGLDNFMLEDESQFDENSANVLIGFLTRLQQPTCLVAHNGMVFDFPMIKRTLEKLKMELPSNVLCVDSLTAFQEIDEAELSYENISNEGKNAQKDIELLEQYTKGEIKTDKSSLAVGAVNDGKELEKNNSDSVVNEMLKQFNEEKITSDDLTIGYLKEAITSSEILAIEELEKALIIDKSLKKDDDTFDDIQKRNETTPKRLPNVNMSERKRKKSNVAEVSRTTPNCKKSLFASSPVKKYPPKGVYKLGNIYKRIFEEDPKITHHAEADVQLLERIILYYGERFLQYAELHAVPFSSVPDL